MESYIFLGIMIVLFCFLLYNFWGMKCCDKTFIQRMGYLQIRSLVHEENKTHYFSISEKERVQWLLEWKIIMDGIDAVSFKQHEQALIWCNDPLNLYPEDFRQLVQNQTTGG